jgi:hypothetical protein
VCVLGVHGARAHGLRRVFWIKCRRRVQKSFFFRDLTSLNPKP